jgi:hypothetical protein
MAGAMGFSAGGDAEGLPCEARFTKNDLFIRHDH